jgi:hypothetical protein
LFAAFPAPLAFCAIAHECVNQMNPRVPAKVSAVILRALAKKAGGALPEETLHKHYTMG